MNVMKKYPKALADVAVLKEVLDYLYRQAEYAEDQVAHYEDEIRKVAEGEEPDRWLVENLAENKAKVEAYIRLAERLAK